MDNSAYTVHNDESGSSAPTSDSTNIAIAQSASTTSRVLTSHSCVCIRRIIRSTIFSFVLGSLLFAAGVILIGLSSANMLRGGDFFIIGPFCIAFGAILLIRGCIRKAADKQRSQGGHVNGSADSHRTQSQRTRIAEQEALDVENIIIPPSYEAVIPKPNAMISAGLQASPKPPTYQRMISTHSQTTDWPNMHSVGVDTSDLPVSTITEDNFQDMPPSYDQALSRRASSVSLEFNAATEVSHEALSYGIPSQDRVQFHIESASSIR